jgi:diguanylate cyclase (GGDEF)-like protein
MTGGEPVLIEQPVRRPDGGEGWVWSLKAPLKDDQGQVVGLVGHGRDITAWKAAEEAARAAEAEAGRARAMLEGAAEILADGFAIFGPDGGLALCNAAFAQIHGTAPARLVGRRFEELADAPAFRAALRMGEAAWAEWLAWRLAKHRAADGVPFEMRLGARWFLIREQRTRDGSVLLVRTDVTHLKHVEEELRRLATTDPLTGVANRRHFVEQGSRLLARASRDGEPASLALLDIDRFKQVNDTHGHAAGDQVLRQISRLCAELSRPGDLLARWGGEEFILLLPRTDLAAAFAVAERLRAAVAALAIEGGGGPPLRVTASFGVAQARAPELDELARRADRALYRAKRRGRDRVEPSRAATA